MTIIDKPILVQFTAWFEEAKAHPDIPDATVMTLATSTAEGRPSSRIVLLKAFDARGFVLFTNYNGRKSIELEANPQAALNIYWPATGKQVRIEGAVEKTSDTESDEYFASRPLESQWGAWASLQSEPLEARAVLMQRFEEIQAQYGDNVPSNMQACV